MNKNFLILIIGMFLVSSVFALPVYVKPLDGSGDLQPSTSFDYVFNFTTNIDCTGVVLSNSSTIVTAKDGVGFVDIDVSGITSVPSYLCEYVDDVYRTNHTLSDQLFRDVYARDVNITGNLTLGEKISFTLGGVIDNLVNGWIRITGGLNVTDNIEVGGNVTADWFNGLFNWTTTDEWSSFDGSTFDFNESKLETTYFLASAVNVVTGIGAGDLADIQTYNRVTYNVTEANSDFELIVNFTGITEFTTLLVRHKTSEVAGHSVSIQLWDYSDSVWEGYGLLSEELTSKMQTLGVYDDSEHIEDGIVQVRFYQEEVGNAGHVHQFDWVGLSKGFGTPVGEEIDPLSLHRDGNTPLTANWDEGGFNLTSVTSWFLGIVKWENVFGLNTTIDSLIGINNDSVVNYIGTVNTSMKNYVDWVNTTNTGGGGEGTLTGEGTAGYIPMWNDTSSLNNSVIYQKGSNVGIGTTTPQQELNVEGDGNITGSLYVLGQNISATTGGTDTFVANYSDFLTHISWTDLINGTFLGDIWTTLFNGTMATTAYVGIQNTSLVNYIGTVNTSMKNYVDTQDAAVNAITLDSHDSTFFMPLNTSVYGNFSFNGGWGSGGLSIINGDIYAQKGWFYDISSLEVSTLTINGSMIPPYGFSNTFDLGNSSLKWRSLYLGGNADITGTINTGQGAFELYGRAGDLLTTAPIIGAANDVFYGADADLVTIGITMEGDLVTTAPITGGVNNIFPGSGTKATIAMAAATSAVHGYMTSTYAGKLDGIETSATADQTAAEILTAIKTVDGAGSGLDADLLDGLDKTHFYNASNPAGYSATTGTVTSVTGTAPIVSSGGTTPAISATILKDAVATAPLLVNGVAAVNDVFLGADSDLTFSMPAATSAVHGYMTSTFASKLNGIESSATADQSAAEILTAIKTVDGAGSGLDADLLDGLNVHNTQSTQNSANQILRTQANGYTMLGWINTVSGSAGTTAPDRIYGSYDPYLRYYTPANFANVMTSSFDPYFLRGNVDDVLTAAIVIPTGSRDEGIIGTYDSTKTQQIWSMGMAYRNSPTGVGFGNLYGLSYQYNGGAGGHGVYLVQNGAATAGLGTNIWTSGQFIGAGTGLTGTAAGLTAGNADKLEGYHGASASTVNTFALRDASGDINTRLFRSEYDTTNPTINYIMTQIDTAANNYIRPSTVAQVKSSLGVGIATSGNADTVDSLHAASFLRSDAADVWNEAGSAIDLRFESDTDTNLLFLDGSANNVGIGTSTPQNLFNVVGDANITGNLNLGEKITFALGEIIDNIVDGWVRVTGGLNVTGDVVVGGDINVTGDVVVGNQKITGLCPTGWIMVPGNASLGTIDFCVMKYEASVRDGVAQSILGGSPWVSITQTSAIAECKEVGAHLCTSQEILTISRDIEQQAVNWQGGVVGTGCLYGGHMDNHPASALATSTDDDAYSGTENTAGEAVVCPFDTTDGKKASKRTFTLSNGEVIWDWSGNVAEWIVNTCSQGTGTGNWDTDAAWQEWNAADLSDYEIITIGPSSSAYTSANGAGKFYGCRTAGNAVRRGGDWGDGVGAGVFYAALDNAPSYSDTHNGFRCCSS